MPRLIDPGDGGAITLDELVARLAESRIDPADEEALAALGPLLAQLGRNPVFLADLAVEELERRCARQEAENSYGPQVIMLRPPDGRYLLRANLWPAANDAAVRASGGAAFAYDMAHDHNFSFLTYGYLGPGYWSDYYLFDGAPRLPGEAAGLTFVERARLAPGQLMLYRAHRDVHVQAPPDSFSVSLNLMAHDPGQAWRTQFRFDVVANTIVEALTVTPAEALATLAAHVGGERGTEVVETLARRHASARMRMVAQAALATAAPGDAVDLWRRAVGDGDPLVVRHARARLAAIESSP